MTAGVALRGLVGIFDPRAPFDEATARARLGKALDGRVDVLAEGHLAVAWTEPQARLGRRENALCVLDGVIYNADALRRELGLPGAVGDEAVVAAGYARWGKEVLDRLRGSFALLLWDRDRRRGLIAQDQFGTRSLYTSTAAGRLLFASEVVPLLGLLPSRPAPDKAALAHWIASLNLPHDGATLFSGIRRVGAGRCIEIDGGWKRTSYWFPRYEASVSLSRADAGEALWEGLARAVRIRVAAGGTHAVLMSGGIDSSSVAAAAVEVLKEGAGAARSYSAVFPDDPDLDESERIDLVARHLGLSSTKIHIRPGGALALSLDYLEAWELPVGGPGYLIEQPLLVRAAEDGVGVVFDGQGGDEVFGLAPYLVADRLRQGRVLSSRQMLRLFPGAERRSPEANQRMWRAFAVNGAVPYRLHRAVRRARGPDRHAPRWLSKESARLYFDRHDPWSWKRTRGVPRWWAHHAYLVSRAREDYGGSDYFRRRAIMAGLEARSPLMDVELVELALRIPPEFFLDPQFDRPLMRAALKGRLPDQVRLHDRKSNLLSFYHRGLTGPDLGLIRRLLGPEAEVSAYVNREVVRDLLDNPPAVGGPAWFMWVSAIWGLVTAECWLRHEADEAFLARLRESPELVRPRWAAIGTPAAA
jgi:asparagine synthase (glutamine-hydrolysing)